MFKINAITVIVIATHQ